MKIFYKATIATILLSLILLILNRISCPYYYIMNEPFRSYHDQGLGYYEYKSRDNMVACIIHTPSLRLCQNHGSLFIFDNGWKKIAHKTFELGRVFSDDESICRLGNKKILNNYRIIEYHESNKTGIIRKPRNKMEEEGIELRFEIKDELKDEKKLEISGVKNNEVIYKFEIFKRKRDEVRYIIINDNVVRFAISHELDYKIKLKEKGLELENIRITKFNWRTGDLEYDKVIPFSAKEYMLTSENLLSTENDREIVLLTKKGFLIYDVNKEELNLKPYPVDLKGLHVTYANFKSLKDYILFIDFGRKVIEYKNGKVKVIYSIINKKIVFVLLLYVVFCIFLVIRKFRMMIKSEQPVLPVVNEST
jgi:hypothetical protein